MVYKKFEKIKLNIIKGRALLPFPTAKVLQDHEDRLRILEEGSSNAEQGSNSGSQQQGASEPQQQEPATPATQNISFTINDGTDPIEGASVVIDETTKTTGSAGGCTFSDITEGSVSVNVSAEGYTSKTETITVDSTHTSFTISLVASSP
ncbi:MAG: carboxypeptidase regulatory-like domain-containing protein [Methanobrevibacter sp.]|nr:carboxypeptidase regulatory-like domain-containing protein [Methanobrevibacter sp.]